MNNVETDRGSLSQYRPPEPKLTILKRPQSSPSNLAAQNGPNGQKEGNKNKTLKQREEEYAQARLRILGAASNPDDLISSEESKEAKSCDSPPTLLIKPDADSNNAIRTPKGPDGTKGFHRRSSKECQQK
jgi:hypothetical protein